MKIIDRKTKNEKGIKSSLFVKFLYNCILGRIILKFLSTRWFAHIVGMFMNSRCSLVLKKIIIKDQEFNLDKFENINYNTYNKIFTRKYSENYLHVDKKINNFISPCNSKLMIIKIKKNSFFEIKKSIYKLHDIIDDNIIDEYQNGYLLIFRLEISDYHRFCYIDDGKRDEYKYINGCLHTVQPISYDKVKVFHRNSREWCVLHTKNFSDIIEVEVGAMLVGKIINDKSKINFKKGEEKGYFEFGGSTILLFVKNNIVKFDDDIVLNSKNGNETIVKYGERIGVKL